MFGQMLDTHLQNGGLAVIATHQPLPLAVARLHSLELM
jgi:ABC-type transport system involved in cytochrome c biogenesis ATPase subunit